MRLLLGFLFVGAVAASPDATNVTGSLALDGINVSWTVIPSTSKVEISLAWEDYDWVAIGLHSKVGGGMKDAEIFLCHSDAASVSEACRIESSAGGYVVPTVEKVNYLDTKSFSKTNGGGGQATFTRDLVVADSKLSVPITDTMLGLIYARGFMSGPNPMKHPGDLKGKWQVNFMKAGVAPAPKPKPPSPGPAPGPQKTAGVWPDRFVATMTMAASQPAKVKLDVSLGSRLFYDFPGLQQRWEYWDINDPTETIIFAETWINYTLYELDTSTDPPGCSAMPFWIQILRPSWPQANEFVMSQYLLRQPPSASPLKSGQCLSPFDELADLFQSPAPIGGMTYSWFAFNSSIGEPFRFTGPDNFQKPTYVSNQDYKSFTPLKTHDPHTFDVPAGCKKSETILGAEHAEKTPLLGRLRPHVSNDKLMAALARSRAARAARSSADELIV